MSFQYDFAAPSSYGGPLFQKQVTGVTTGSSQTTNAMLFDQVDPQEVAKCVWSVVAIQEGTSNIQSIEVHAIHNAYNGVEGDDMDYSVSTNLIVGNPIPNFSIAADLALVTFVAEGNAQRQMLRLVGKAEESTTINITRKVVLRDPSTYQQQSKAEIQLETELQQRLATGAVTVITI